MVARRASPQERFRALFEAHEKPLLGYALRRTPTPADAAEVLAETMTVAWRRIEDVPPGEEARLWLFGVARRVLANDRRGQERRGRLAAKLEVVAARLPASDPADAVVVDATVSAAIDLLGEADRELIRLAYWEQLTPAEIAVVVDAPAATVRTRLHRARSRLRTMLLEPDPNGDGALDGGDRSGLAVDHPAVGPAAPVRSSVVSRERSASAGHVWGGRNTPSRSNEEVPR